MGRGLLAAAAVTASIAIGMTWASAQTDGVKPELVVFPGGVSVLRGYIWMPPGADVLQPEARRFPAILWNHGSEKYPGSASTIAPFFVKLGYVFFVPHRRGQGRSPGPYIMDQLNAVPPGRARSRLLVELQERHLQDQLTALKYLRGRPRVDTSRLVVMGASFGGIQTVLALDQDTGYRVAVDCSGASQVWQTSPDIQARMESAARGARMPVYFLQAANDYNLMPNQVLSGIVSRHGVTAVSKVYPGYGQGHADGHHFCGKGTAIWGPDVASFIAPYLPVVPPLAK
jgi:dienelactone hydrolase